MPLLADGGASLFVLTLFNALTEGSTFALIAVGYTMVYGIVRLINFAHGEVYMIGAVSAWWAFVTPQVPLWLALLLAMAVCAGLGWLLERLAYRPLRARRPLTLAGAAAFYAVVAAAAWKWDALAGVAAWTLCFALFVGAWAGNRALVRRGLVVPARAAMAPPSRLTALITAIGMSLILQTAVQLLLDPNFHSFPDAGRARARVETTARERPEAAAPALDTLRPGVEPQVVRGEPEVEGWVAIAWQPPRERAPRTVWVAEGDVEVKQGLPPAVEANVLGQSGLKLPLKDVLVWLAAALMMAALHWLVQRTRLGKAMRACALDQTTAALMGIDVNRVIAATFMIGSAMAAVAGVLYSVKVGGNISFRMGYYPGVIAFAAAVLGGIGDLKGALLGGMLLGFAKAFWASYLPAEYDFACCFTVMILVIIFRPYGLLGRPSSVRA